MAQIGWIQGPKHYWKNKNKRQCQNVTNDAVIAFYFWLSATISNVFYH